MTGKQLPLSHQPWSCNQVIVSPSWTWWNWNFGLLLVLYPGCIDVCPDPPRKSHTVLVPEHGQRKPKTGLRWRRVVTGACNGCSYLCIHSTAVATFLHVVRADGVPPCCGGDCLLPETKFMQPRLSYLGRLSQGSCLLLCGMEWSTSLMNGVCSVRMGLPPILLVD